MRKFIIVALIVFCADFANGQFSISENNRFILKNGKPFFWLGDTAWELFHRLDSTEADLYLRTRHEQGFTVIQAVVLAEMDGVRLPNPYGDVPLIDSNPATPNEKYFRHVDWIVDRAAKYDLSIAMLPTWGDKIFADRWGKGPEIFTEKNAAQYGDWLATRYKNRNNIIWVLGGDRNPRDAKDLAIWNAMGNAIQQASGNTALITYHPQPNEKGSAEWFHRESWLRFNFFQTGHCRETPVYDRIAGVYAMDPVKPVMDGEPIYEDHPVCFNPADLGTSNAYDIRRAAWLDVFAGAFGHTYGCHDVWQMYSAKFEPVNGPHLYWTEAIKLPGARQMVHVRKLIESFPMLDRVPDQSAIAEHNLSSAERIQATRGKDYLLVYTAVGKSITVLPAKISGSELNAWWYDPRNGKTVAAGTMKNDRSKKFTPPSTGYGKDWVLVLADASKSYKL